MPTPPASPSCAAVARRPLDLPFERAVAALARRPGFWWLDSACADGRLGRFSFAGCAPPLTLCVRDGRVELAGPEAGAAARAAAAAARAAGGGPLAVLRALRPSPPADAEGLEGWPFLGGLVGAFGYELGAALDPVPVAAGAGEDAPELLFHRVDALVAHDHARGETLALGLGVAGDLATARARAAARADALRQAVGGGAAWPAAAAPAGAPGLEPVPGLDASAYAKAVDRIRERIAEGALYQACLTHRIETRWDGDPLALHRRLRRESPAPFAAFLRHGDLALVSSSPERFLRVGASGEVESRPIKGTRPRGTSPERDAALRAALAASPKDRAENLMIVDLVRNDLGRVCATGSVTVPELFAVESYAHVHQMVSTVRGRLAPERDALDAVAAAFPPGSMTGAPKLAAMTLLARLEPVRRGLYAGALGYLDARGGADLAVVIRTAFVRPGRLAVHTGGGIVADSEPAAEWEEACAKAAGVLEAATRAQGDGGA